VARTTRCLKLIPMPSEASFTGEWRDQSFSGGRARPGR